MVRALHLLSLLLGTFLLCEATTDASRKDQILATYDPDLLPPDRPVTVNVGMNLNYVQEVSDDVVEVDCWLLMRWTDSRLASDSSAPTLNLPQSYLWVPDITVYNELDVLRSGVAKHKAVVDASGGVTIVDRMTTFVPCTAQEGGARECKVKVGSWTYNGELVDLALDSEQIDISHLVPNSRFSVTGTSATRNSMTYDCCPENYVDATFSFTLIENSSE